MRNRGVCSSFGVPSGSGQIIRDELDCSMAQLALAWCTKNPNVSTVITGASRPSQVVENFGALDVIPRLDADALARIEAALR